ncbi:MAG: formylglycine-generating enzyme family protein [Nitrospinaceae bacterium]
MVRKSFIIFFAAIWLWGSQSEAGLPKGSGSSIDSDMVLIPEGVFTMGSSPRDIDWVVKKFFSASRDWYLDETPARKIYLGDFYIDRFEVTNAQYEKFRKAAGLPEPKFMDSRRFNEPGQPVVGITWNQAVEYCRWAGKRLPTEEEWEKAARGASARHYPWGNEPDNDKANIRGLEDNFRYTAPVGQYEEGKSPYGVMDMAGNVWEWTTDWYQPYEGNKHENDMYGTSLRVIKGGSWNSNMDLARSAIRGKALPDQRLNYIGFRCAREP